MKAGKLKSGAPNSNLVQPVGISPTKKVQPAVQKLMRWTTKPRPQS